MRGLTPPAAFGPHMSYVRSIYHDLREKPVFLWSQAVGFKVLVALVPVVLLATGILGQVLRRDRPLGLVQSTLRDVLPAYQSEELLELIGQLQGVSGRLTLVGALGLAVTAITLFTTLRTILAGIFQESWHVERSLLRGYAFDLRMAIQVGFVFTLSVVLTIFVQQMQAGVLWGLSELGIETTFLESGWRVLLQAAAYLVPLAFSFTMFVQLFYFTPVPHPPWRSAAAGALVSAVLWDATKILFSFYASRIGGFDNQGLTALGDTFVLVIILVFWAYFSGLVFCIGGITCVIHERRHRSLRESHA